MQNVAAAEFNATYAENHLNSVKERYYREAATGTEYQEAKDAYRAAQEELVDVRIRRYAKDILPAMDADKLMDELVRAEVANQNVEGHQYGEMQRQINLIRDEIRNRFQ